MASECENYHSIKAEILDGIAILTINRPQVLNALNSAVLLEMNGFLENVERRKDIRVMVITGEGKAFVAGADIAEMLDLDPQQALLFAKQGQTTFERFENLPFPVIAAVNGYALGGGCELAMSCDFRIASKTARFGQPEMSLGLIPGYAGTQRLTKIVGVGNALYLILTGETITAEDAFRIGLVQKVTEPESLMSETMKLAHKIASNGSKALSKAKEVIRKGAGMEFHEAMQLEAEGFSSLFAHDVTREGMKAFLEKRKPIW
jgi:enoyl-CoA hydratase